MNIFDMRFWPVDFLLTIWVEKTSFEREIVPDQWSGKHRVERFGNDSSQEEPDFGVGLRGIS